MNNSKKEPSAIIRTLDDGFILRHSTSADADKLAEFNARIHGNQKTGEPELRVAAFTCDLLNGKHPTFKMDDFTIVEDPKTDRIISSMNLISQTWSYAGIPFKVGRPEIVGTDPEFRHRGLVRAQFDEVHRWSQARGEMVQAITGIPYYYRLFSYEMALELGGQACGYGAQVPKHDAQTPSRFFIQPATEEDLPFVANLYQESGKRYLVHCQRDLTYWKYELKGKSILNADRHEIRIIKDEQKNPIGFLVHLAYTEEDTLFAKYFELIPGTAWHEVAPEVITYLWNSGQQYAAENKKTCTRFGFNLGSQHSVYQAAGDWLPYHRKPYAHYLRVPDLPAFLQQIAPVIENRLYSSPFASYHGDLSITFYHSEIWMHFDHGKLSRVEKVIPGDWEKANVNFPGLTFLQLVFGYKSVEEIQNAFPDCLISERYRHLLNALFPKLPSLILPIS